MKDEKKKIVAGWLIDGTGGEVQRRVMLQVRRGVISSVEKIAAHEKLDDDVIDLSHGTILPTLVDSHVHLAMSGSVAGPERDRQLSADCRELSSLITRHLGYLFSHGVLAVRDGGDRQGCVADYLAAAGDDIPVLVRSSGRALHDKGRYGGLIGGHPEGGRTLAGEYKARSASCDQVKLVNSGLNSLKEFGRRTAPQFYRDEIRELVNAARQNDLQVMVHANGEEPVAEALAAGCRSIEHGFFMGRDNLAKMADQGVVWVPTAVTMKAYAEHLSHSGDSAGADIARRNLEDQLAQLALARELGVTVALGTDAGSPGVLHGESVVEEIKLLIRAGYNLAESIRCATANGARLLGLDDCGQLLPGRRADFIVARGAPSQLPRKLSYLEDIYVGGSPHPQYRKNPYKHVNL